MPHTRTSPCAGVRLRRSSQHRCAHPDAADRAACPARLARPAASDRTAFGPSGLSWLLPPPLHLFLGPPAKWPPARLALVFSAHSRHRRLPCRPPRLHVVHACGWGGWGPPHGPACVLRTGCWASAAADALFVECSAPGQGAPMGTYVLRAARWWRARACRGGEWVHSVQRVPTRSWWYPKRAGLKRDDVPADGLRTDRCLDAGWRGAVPTTGCGCCSM